LISSEGDAAVGRAAASRTRPSKLAWKLGKIHSKFKIQLQKLLLARAYLVSGFGVRRHSNGRAARAARTTRSASVQGGRDARARGQFPRHPKCLNLNSRLSEPTAGAGPGRARPPWRSRRVATVHHGLVAPAPVPRLSDPSPPAQLCGEHRRFILSCQDPKL
jgi:hypothetical protein